MAVPSAPRQAGGWLFGTAAENAAVGWVGNWLRAWRSQPLELVSPLSLRAVRNRLIADSTPYWLAFFMLGGGGGHMVSARVGTHRISFEVANSGVRNSWRTVVHGYLEPAGTGCRFVGTIGISPIVKVFSGLWLGVVTCGFVACVASAVISAARGEATVEDALSCLVPLAMMVGFVAVSAAGTLVDRGEDAYLRSWLIDRLQAEGAGGIR